MDQLARLWLLVVQLGELLPPLKHRPWVTVQERPDRARETLATVRLHEHDVAVFPNGRDLYVVRRGKGPPSPFIASLVNARHNALVALVRFPEECESVVRVTVPREPRL